MIQEMCSMLILLKLIFLKLVILNLAEYSDLFCAIVQLGVIKKSKIEFSLVTGNWVKSL